jgi:hypothetical protein
MRSMISVSILLISLFAKAQTAPQSCITNPALQPAKSAELIQLAKDDQDDRSNPRDIDWSKVGPRDLDRRIKVATIFAQGCFKVAADFASAALVFQHGDSADQAYQTFIWAKRAVDLGDATQKSLVVKGLDRYLVRIGHKQLFGTQYALDFGNPCMCFEPLEESFPDGKRPEYLGMTLEENRLLIIKEYKVSQSCLPIRICERSVQSTPAGSIPGFW